MQRQLGLRRCCALPASCRQEKYDHATQQDAQKKHSVLLLIDTAAAIVTGFSQSHLLYITQQDVVSSLSYYNTQMIHNNTVLLAAKAGNV